MTYEYQETGDRKGANRFYSVLLQDFTEGGAEYLRIINHSTDKKIEFFFIDTKPYSFNSLPVLPDIWHKSAPVYYLLYPDRKPPRNILLNDGTTVYFEGDRIGDLTVNQAWSIGSLAALYRQEYARSTEVQLTIYENRIIDLVEGITPIWGEKYKDKIFYGVLEPGEKLQGSKSIWLLALPSVMFTTDFGWGAP